MRVCLLADKLNVRRGGSNFSLDLIARTLHERGHDVTVLTVHFDYENDLPAEHRYRVVEEPVASSTRVGDARTVLRLMEEHEADFDVYHVFNPALLPIAGYYRRRGGETPVVGRLNSYAVFCTNHARMDGKCQERCTVSRKFAHDGRYTIRGKIANLPKYAFDTVATPRLLNEVDRLFALSPAVERIYRGVGVDSDRLSLVPNFYDPAFGRNDVNPVQTEFDRSLLYVGTLATHKGVDVLVDAVADLPADVGVDIVGEGPQRDTLTRQATHRGVADRVRFHGWVEHEFLPGYYRAATALVHPGLWPEPFNRTLLEAMQCDCPQVVSNIGGPPWVIEGCGLTFERGDPTSLAEAINLLLKDDGLRKSCQERCTERVEEFAPSRSISLLEEQYDAVH